MIHVTLYGRTDCHLCTEMRAVVEAVAGQVPLALDYVDVDGDPALVAAYGDEVPVLCVNGRRAFSVRVDVGTLRDRLLRETA